MSMARLLDEISELSPTGRAFKPHKQLLLLAVLNLVRDGHIRGNTVAYDQALRDEFSRVIALHGGREDRDRPHAPFFHLRGTSFWKLVPVQGRERDLEAAVTVGGPGELADLVQCAEMSPALASALATEPERAEIEARLLHCIRAGLMARSTAPGSVDEAGETVMERLSLTTLEGQVNYRNPFVAYLNSLQRLGAGNENALAEFQACSSFFHRIHVRHPLTDRILGELQRPNGWHIILTGHAGDGKSTIALSVFRELSGVQGEEPLPRQPRPREDLADNIVIIKDLSERRKDQDATLMDEVLSGQRRFLIVSNTGALLDFFRGQSSPLGASPPAVESEVLTAIGNDQGVAKLILGSGRFLVFNLACQDNLEIAREIFTRMIDSRNWQRCVDLPCRTNCPICLNVELINHCRETVLDRLFLAYRRMYEYGTRLTLRQITEHLAYLITSGLEEGDIAEMRARGVSPLKAEFMFFNRFFGDDGKGDHAPAAQMRAVQEVRRQGFGSWPCPTWERRLWLKQAGSRFRLGIPDCDQEFELLRNHGSGPGDDSRPGMTPDQSREQVRRMLFFLYEFAADERSYIPRFLNSPSILRWREWQEADAPLEMADRNVFEQRIFHVLQEHFTGVRLPEGAKETDRRLYVTLSRGKADIRQSAQVVIAQLDWSNETSLELISRPGVSGGGRRDLVLKGRGRIKDASLVLTLPFLDYVLMRHFGEVGEILQAAYIERLERFKAQVQDLAVESPTSVMLVRLKTDHTFRRQQYSVRNGKLEVSDVL